jgi:predicted nucleic acid-binding Zn ribbon protein
MSLLSRAHSGITVPTCPRCGRKVARGRVYCDDHLKETINRYRDEQREKGA